MASTAAILPARVRVHSRTEAGASAAAIAWAGILTLALAAPFELLEPIVRLPWQAITNLELALVAAGTAWLVATAWRGDAAWWRAPLAGPWLALILTMTVSAAVAPEWRMNALHMVGRLAMALGVCLIASSGVTTRARAHRLMAAACVSGVAAASLAILEYSGVAAVVATLRAFRPGLAVVGGQIRASGPLQYPTIASMYFEIVFAFLLGLLVVACVRRRWFAAATCLAASVVVAEAIVLTFTRTGVLAMGAALLFVGEGQRRRRGWRDASVQAVGALCLVVAALVASSHSLEAMRLRLTTETETAWFRARIQAPERVALRTGEFAVVPVTLTNAGRAVWDSDADPPLRLSYHWLLGNDDRVVGYDGLRTTFAQPVAPGDTVALEARVRAPMRPGEYRLMWDLVEEQRMWFSTEPNARFTFSRAVVTGAPVGPPGALRLTTLPRSASRPGRLVLWAAAARMFAAHPLLGVGLDNYRLSYGSWARIADADPRVHSNNLYVEMLVGGGAIGGLAFAWLLCLAAGRFAAAVQADAARESAIVGVAAAGIVILLHGVVDTFLGFTPTYILIALTVGLAVACGRTTGRDPDADRV